MLKIIRKDRYLPIFEPLNRETFSRVHNVNDRPCGGGEMIAVAMIGLVGEDKTLPHSTQVERFWKTASAGILRSNVFQHASRVIDRTE